MKGFDRKEPLFSLCGLKCGLCVMYLGGYCPGCGGGEGNQACSIAKCGMGRGDIQYCFECEEYPCGKYEKMDEYDSFVPHRSRKEDLERARRIGIERYMAELREKIRILHLLLERYNDGRHKTFFDTAVYLLELSDLRALMRILENQTAEEDLPLKEKTAAAVRLFRNMADQRGISLKLRKKPGEKKKN